MNIEMTPGNVLLEEIKKETVTAGGIHLTTTTQKSLILKARVIAYTQPKYVKDEEALRPGDVVYVPRVSGESVVAMPFDHDGGTYFICEDCQIVAREKR